MLRVVPLSSVSTYLPTYLKNTSMHFCNSEDSRKKHGFSKLFKYYLQRFACLLVAKSLSNIPMPLDLHLKIQTRVFQIAQILTSPAGVRKRQYVYNRPPFSRLFNITCRFVNFFTTKSHTF